MAEPSTVELVRTRPGDSWRWMRGDLAVRLLPFAAVVAGAQLLWRPPWLGIAAGSIPVQLGFGVLMGAAMFGGAVFLQLRLSHRRGALRVPAGMSDVGTQVLYYAVNAPLEEAFFRGLVQGGVAALLGGPVGFLVGTSCYVLYHRLGSWTWTDTLTTALAGVPLGLGYWLLPGPASLLGVSIAHFAATNGFLGLGPYLFRNRLA